MQISYSTADFKYKLNTPRKGRVYYLSVHTIPYFPNLKCLPIKETYQSIMAKLCLSLDV